MTLDSGALTAAAAGDARVRASLTAFRRNDVEVVLPAVVLTESTTGDGPRDARINLLVKGCAVEPVTEVIARRAAALRHRVGRPELTMNAVVVATAEQVGGGALLTRDLADCTVLAADTRVRVEQP